MNFHGRAVLIALEWQRVHCCLQVRRSFTKLRGEDLGEAQKMRLILLHISS